LNFVQTSPVGGFLALLCAVLCGCRGCLGDSALSVKGEHPYVRCLAAKAPSSGSHEIGKARLRFEERELRIAGLSYPIRIAAFSGPGPGAPLGADGVAALKAQKPDLVFLLGDVGDDTATARATFAALGQLGVPVLVVAGGRDTRARIAEAAAGPERRIIDVTTVRAVRLARDTFVPVAGAPDGRYALNADACGYAKTDLQQLARELGEAPDSRHWLLAWHAPAGHARAAVARTEEGLDLGSASLAELASHIAAPGGLFAWPHVQAMRPLDAVTGAPLAFGVPSANLALVVPRVSGSALERSDGSSVAPGFALLRLDGSGLALLDPRQSASK
jgi:hypothetical protein